MKILNAVSLFLFTTLLLPVTAQTPSDVLSTIYAITDLKEEIRSLRHSYYLIDSDVKKLGGPIKEFTFDKKKNILKVTLYIAPDTLKAYQTETYFFNEKNDLIGLIKIKQQDTIEHYRYKLIYNKDLLIQRQLLEIISHKKSSIAHTDKFAYDVKGRLISKTEYQGVNQFEQRYIYSYTTKGHQASKTWYVSSSGFHSMIPCKPGQSPWHVPDSSFHISWRYEYDHRDRLIKETELNARKCPVKTTITQYDSMGNKLKTLLTDNNGNVLSKWEGQYNTSGQLLSERNLNSANEIVSILNEYDVQGNKTKVTVNNSDGLNQSTTYQFDSHRNWTQVLLRYKGEAVSTSIRKITYP